MDELVLHAATQKQLASFIARPSHALLLNGPLGAGKQFVARTLAARLLSIPESRVGSSAYFLQIEPEGKAIPIEAIRSLNQFFKLRVPAHEGSINRVVVIANAQALTTEAQQAFLKLLEEPPEGSVLILTTPNARSLLPTIVSRTQQVALKPVGAAAIAEHFKGLGFDEKAIQKAHLVANGNVGLMQALLGDDEEHPLFQQIEEAKKVLQADAFGRLSQIDMLASPKNDVNLFLAALERVVHAALHRALQQSKEAKPWHRRLKAITAAQAALAHNPNVKLLLTDLFLQM